MSLAAAGGPMAQEWSPAQPCPAGSRDGVRWERLQRFAPPHAGPGGVSGGGQARPPSPPGPFLLWTDGSARRGLLTGDMIPAPSFPTWHGQDGVRAGSPSAPCPCCPGSASPRLGPSRVLLAERLWPGRAAGTGGRQRAPSWRVDSTWKPRWARTRRSPGPASCPAGTCSPAPLTDGCTALLARPVIGGLVIRGQRRVLDLFPVLRRVRQPLPRPSPPPPPSLPPPPPPRSTRLRGGSHGTDVGQVCRNRASVPSCLIGFPCPASRSSYRFQPMAAGDRSPAGASSAGRWSVSTPRDRAGGGGGEGGGLRRPSLAHPPLSARLYQLLHLQPLGGQSRAGPRPCWKGGSLWLSAGRLRGQCAPGGRCTALCAHLSTPQPRGPCARRCLVQQRAQRGLRPCARRAGGQRGGSEVRTLSVSSPGTRADEQRCGPRPWGHAWLWPSCPCRWALGRASQPRVWAPWRHGPIAASSQTWMGLLSPTPPWARPGAVGTRSL
ncbi:PREDICTED: WAS/WASL-interacting protein family member 3 isoform X1 [Myotis davidii]|uniref:WAS/WASL-interacting protein family member 3 isoform X1 n=1 Tax=Myotis davidii TaxID=225400 RepID=UPI000767B127|nr:PREDICTED: WAS/WASL-interacting protein family member 3 isoform X1 [Myotis davidii]XP_015418250.1 PREDICTED: WAS/WASL-interacting protein family member 3 isoform X1 [Myotis davidii]